MDFWLIRLRLGQTFPYLSFVTNDEKLHSTARHLRQICSHKPEIKHKRRRFPDSPTLTYAEQPHGLTSRCQIAGYQIWFRVFTQAFWDDLQVWVKPFNVCGIKTFLTRIPCLRASAKFSSQGVVKPFIINAYNGSGPVFEPAGFNRLEWKVAWRKGMVFTSSSCNACLSALCGLWREAWKNAQTDSFLSPSFFLSMENKWNGHHFLSKIALWGHKIYPAVLLLWKKNSLHRRKLKTRSS